MCKKSLLMMLLLALLVPWAAKAQSEPYEVQIGEGTSTSGYFPFYTLYNYSIAENLFLASELEEAGVPSGTVTSLSWYATNETGYAQQGISVWMANVSDEALTTTSHATTDMTLVYTGSVTPVTGWNEFMFNEETFIWDGTSNILILCQRNNGTWNSTVNWQATTEVGFNAMTYKYQDSGAYDVTVPNTGMSTSTTRPNIIIKGVGESSGPVCTKPSTLDVTDITGFGATCTWENTGAASYTFEYKATAASDWTVVTGLTANTYTLSNLEPFTAYSVRVKAVCGTDLESGYKSASFTTLDVCPDGKVCIGEGTATNSYLPTYNYYNYSLTQQIYSADEIGEAALIESVDIYSVGSVTRNLEIYMVNTEKITFDSVTDWIPATESNRVFSGSVAFAANSWNTMEFDNPFIYDGRHNVVLIVRDITGSYVSSINFFVFNAQGNQAIRAYRDTPGAYDITAPGVSGALLGVKNRVRFGVSELPSCFQPTGLTVSNIEARQAVLSWTENGTATTWDVEVTGDYATTWTATTNPYTLVGLEPDTDYTVKVRANCGGGDYSEWSNEISFTTDVTCHVPTTLSVSDIEAFSANVNWTGTETTYQLRYVDNPNYFFQGFVTDPGAMSDGADASWLHGANSFGPGAQHSVGNMLADDFTVNTATALSEIEVYSYQTGSTTESTYTGLYAVIYDGNPAEEGSNIVWGDMETNIMTSTAFTNCYRGSDGETTAMTRPIMSITASGLNIELEPGTYWLAYNLAGTGSSGPWGVPHCDAMGTVPGDGLQYSDNNWHSLTDNNVGAYGPAMKLMFGDMEAFDWTYVNNIEANTYAMTNLEPETPYLVQVRATCGGNDGNSEWATTTFTTLPTCMTPTALTVSDIEARQVVLSWTENGDATAWDVEVTGEYTTTWNATTNPYTLVGLEPSTRYTVKVRAKCSDTDFSEWSTEVVFTTDVSCHAPTNLTITDITRSSATIGWTSDNDNFELWYREHAVGGTLTTNFDDSNMNGWTTIDADNDGFTWVLGSETGSIYLVEGGSLAGNGHNDSEDMMCSGSYSNYTGAALTPDNYLVSPQVALGGSITFWAQAQDGDYPEEHFGVAVSTTGNTNAADFTTIQEWTLTAKSRGASDVADNAYNNRTRGGNRDTGVWYEYTVDLSAYSGTGYVAIRHFNCTDQFILNVDDIVIEQPAAGGPVEWIEVNNATNPYTITGLNPETTYDVKVRSNCGEEDGYSAWLQGSFTTDVACPTPEALAATPYALSAELSWEGVSESYTVRYGIIEVGETLSSFDFEDETIPADFTNSTSYPWTVTEGGADGSGYCVIPGNAGVNSSTSDLTLQVTGPCAVSFMAKVSSENNWDWGRFLIDGTQQMQISGTKDWESYSYTVAAGTHTLVWRYYKDSSSSSNDDLFYVDNIVINEMSYAWETTTATTNECVITGLEPATTYYVQVMGDCGDFGTSEWSEMISFTTTEDACPVPTNLTDNAETLTATTADLSWDGSLDVESFTVRYRAPQHAAEGALYEAFGTSIPTGWTLYNGLLDTVMVRPSALTSATYGWNFGTGNGVFDTHARVNIYGNYQRWLVTPEVTVAAGANLAFDLALTVYTSGSNASPTPGNQADDKFIVLISTDSLQTWTILRQWDNQGSEYVYDEITNDANGQPVSIDLSAYAGQTVHIAFYGESTVSGGDNNLHIDNVIIGEVIPATDWQTVTTTETNVTLTGLTPETPYEAQVKSDCSDPEAWSNTVNFTTLEQTIVTQTIALSAGWNWVSFNVEITLADLEGALEAAYPSAANNALVIKAKVGGQTAYNPMAHRWIGGLQSIGLDLSQMYLVKVPTEGEITLEGMPINPEDYPATIAPGVNWIAFPLSESMTIAEAFAGFPTNQDIVKAKTGGQAQWNSAARRWIGGLANTPLQPGQGYIYNSKASETRTFTFPTPAK